VPLVPGHENWPSDLIILITPDVVRTATPRRREKSEQDHGCLPNGLFGP